jgi:hypothetical protein
LKGSEEILTDMVSCRVDGTNTGSLSGNLETNIWMPDERYITDQAPEAERQ